ASPTSCSSTSRCRPSTAGASWPRAAMRCASRGAGPRSSSGWPTTRTPSGRCGSARTPGRPTMRRSSPPRADFSPRFPPEGTIGTGPVFSWRTQEGRRTQMATVPRADLPRTDDEWRERLTAEQYEVARKAGTERAFTGEYWDCHDDGVYECVCCGAPLFSSDTKFESGTGWPSFFQALDADAVEERVDTSHGMVRT